MSRRGRGGRNRHNNKNQRGDRNGGHGPRQEHRQPGRSDQHGSLQTNTDAVQAPRQQQAGKVAFQSAIQPKRTLSRPPKEPAVVGRPTDRAYKVAFYDTLTQAKSDLDALRELAKQCDQLNIVVKAEAPMDDADLTSIGKLFCGAAWALIHERRKMDGWYDQPHE